MICARANSQAPLIFNLLVSGCSEVYRRESGGGAYDILYSKSQGQRNTQHILLIDIYMKHSFGLGTIMILNNIFNNL